MKRISIFFIFLFSIEAYSSGSYSRYSRRSFRPAKKTKPINKLNIDSSKFYPKRKKTMSSYIFKIKQPGMAIHNIDVTRKVFKIKGVYESFNNLRKFVKLLEEPALSGKKVKLIKTKTRFAGVITKRFEIIGDNLW